MPSVSILLNTLNRFELLSKCIGPALATAGYPFDLMVCDNGSSDKRVIDYFWGRPELVYHRLNDKNEGCGQMHNQMLLRATTELFCLLDDDIELRRDNWLRDLVSTYLAIPDSGMSGIHSEGLSPEQHPLVELNGRSVHRALPPKEDAVFGTRLFGRQVLNKVGYFCEDYGPYGLVDNEYNTRVHHSGFVNYYIGGSSGLHHGTDVGKNTDYRKMKDESMRVAAPVLAANLARYFEAQNFYVPPPIVR